MRRYGKWAGNENGDPEDPTRCVVAARGDLMHGVHPHQCHRKRGHGPKGLYCTQHADMIWRGKHVFVPEDESIDAGGGR